MKVIKASYEIMNKENIDGLELLKTIERVGRTCYKSEDKITDESAVKFVTNLIKRGHEAMIEHNIISVRFICDRGISHELVRHRVASFGQESTRYCNYSKDKFGNQVTFINLMNGIELDTKMKDMTVEEIDMILNEWEEACKDAEKHYFNMLDIGESFLECLDKEQERIKLLETETKIQNNTEELIELYKNQGLTDNVYLSQQDLQRVKKNREYSVQ